MAETGACLNTIKAALKELREEGSIKPVHNVKGGRSLPTTWLLCVPGRAASPSQDRDEALQAARSRDAAWRFLSQKYGPARALEIMGDP